MFDWFGWNSSGPKAHSMPAQANGLGMMQAKPSRAECPVYKGLVRAFGGLNPETEVQLRIQAFGTTETLRTTEKTEMG